MFDNIKYSMARKALLRQEREQRFVSWSDANTILILFRSDNQENNSEIRNLIKAIEKDGKMVVAIGYVDKKKADTASIDRYIMLDRSMVNFLGRPKEEAVASKLDERYDIVIDLTPDVCVPLVYMLSLTQYYMRCGKKDSNRSGIYDFVIDLPAPPIDAETGAISLAYCEAKELGEQIIKYLRQMRSR